MGRSTGLSLHVCSWRERELKQQTVNCVQTGKCEVSRCQYAHSKDELRRYSDCLKTQLCAFWKKGSLPVPFVWAMLSSKLTHIRVSVQDFVKAENCVGMPMAKTNFRGALA